jgi:hypothetical protein
MLIQQNSTNSESSSYDQDKYQLALDAVIKQMNLLSNDPSNENLRLAHEQARQRFIQISNMERDEYEKFIHSKLPSIILQNRINNSSQDRIQHIEQSWLYNIQNIYICYSILIFFFLTLTLICITIALK